MFKRRQPRTIPQNLREIFWPSMGWLRAGKYVKHRVLRLSDSEQKIAAGLAIGTSISFTPIVGTHFIQAGIIAYISRTNILAACIGTFAGNPWTFPFMWWSAIFTGTYIFSLLGWNDYIIPLDQLDLKMLGDTLKLFAEVMALVFKIGFHSMIDLAGFGTPSFGAMSGELSAIWSSFTDNFFRIFVPWLFGGYLIALCSWPFTYSFYYFIVKNAKAARRKAKLHRLQKVAKEVTGQAK